MEAVGVLEWTVLPGDDCTVTYNTINPRPPVGAVTSLCDDGHTVVLDAEETNNHGTFVFSSSLNVTVQENLTVTCVYTSEPETAESATISVASKLYC